MEGWAEFLQDMQSYYQARWGQGGGGPGGGRGSSAEACPGVRGAPQPCRSDGLVGHMGRGCASTRAAARRMPAARSFQLSLPRVPASAARRQVDLDVLSDSFRKEQRDYYLQTAQVRCPTRPSRCRHVAATVPVGRPVGAVAAAPPPLGAPAPRPCARCRQPSGGHPRIHTRPCPPPARSGATSTPASCWGLARPSSHMTSTRSPWRSSRWAGGWGGGAGIAGLGVGARSCLAAVPAPHPPAGGANVGSGQHTPGCARRAARCRRAGL